MKLKTKGIALIAAVLVTVPIALFDAGQGGGTGGPTSSLSILVPGSAGGGYDSLARESQQSLRANGISGNVQVINIPGASGTVGLQTLIEMNDRDDTMLVVGSAMVGGVEITGSDVGLDDVTPIMAVTTDYPVIVLPESSPYGDATEFLSAWKADPEGHPIGGGALGNADHLAVIALAEASGIAAEDVNYIAYSGGGEVLGSLLSGTVAAGVSGYSEISDQIETNRVRGIGITAPERIEGIDLPTFAEAGVDVVMPNWRGFVAPPNITDEERDALVTIVEEMLQTEEWKAAVVRNDWEERVLVGDEFVAFIEDQVDITQQLLEGVEK